MFKNFIWDFIGRLGGQAISFIISVLLTRRLDPAEFGLMGMAAVIIAIASIFLDMGFRLALVQKKEVTQEEFSGVFFISLFISVFLFLVCFGLAHSLANFYKQPQVESVVKVLSIIFIVNALILIPNTIIYKKMNFRIISIFNIVAAGISGATGVILAYKGFGVWSLVAQTLLNNIVLFLLYQFYTRWRPTIAFKLAAVKSLWGYGSRMFLTTLIDNLFSRLDILVIGKLFTVQTVGYYSRAQSFDQLIRQFSSTNIVTVLFPHIASLQNDRKELQTIYIKYLHIIAFISLGLSGILFVTARPLFTILFTAKWAFAADLFKIMAIMSFAYPVSALMCNVIAGVGNSKALLRLEIPKRIFMIIGFVIGFAWGIKGFLYAMIGVAIIGISLNTIVCGKEVEMSLQSQWRIILTYILTAGISASIAELILLVLNTSSPYINVAAGCAGFSVAYLLLNYFTKAKGLFHLTNKLVFFRYIKPFIT